MPEPPRPHRFGIGFDTSNPASEHNEFGEDLAGRHFAYMCTVSSLDRSLW